MATNINMTINVSRCYIHNIWNRKASIHVHNRVYIISIYIFSFIVKQLNWSIKRPPDGSRDAVHFNSISSDLFARGEYFIRCNKNAIISMLVTVDGRYTMGVARRGYWDSNNHPRNVYQRTASPRLLNHQEVHVYDGLYRIINYLKIHNFIDKYFLQNSLVLINIRKVGLYILNTHLYCIK